MLKVIVEEFKFDISRVEKTISAETLLRELLGGDEHKRYECSESRWSRFVIHTVCKNELASRSAYSVYDTSYPSDFRFVENVMMALVAPGASTDPWHATSLNERRTFFLAALDLKSRVSVKDLIAAYDLMAETGKSLPVLVGELGLV